MASTNERSFPLRAILHSGLRFGCLLHFTRTQGSHLRACATRDSTRTRVQYSSDTYTCSTARSQTQQRGAAHTRYASSFEFAKLKFCQFFLEPVFAQFAKFNARQNFPLYGIRIDYMQGKSPRINKYYLQNCIS